MSGEAEKKGARTNGVLPRTPGPMLVNYGLPCANCRTYYVADLTSCPICGSEERVSPNISLQLHRNQGY